MSIYFLFLKILNSSINRLNSLETLHFKTQLLALQERLRLSFERGATIDGTSLKMRG